MTPFLYFVAGAALTVAVLAAAFRWWRERRDGADAHFRLVFDHAGAGMALLSPDGRILRGNAALGRLLGCPAGELRGRALWEFLAEPQAGAARERFGRDWGARPGAYEAARRPRGGEERLIAWRCSAVGDARGGARHVIAVAFDVTDRGRLEGQRRRAHTLAALATFVGGVTHDFNNQLTTVLGNLGLALADTPPDDLRHELLRDAEQAAERCAALTARLGAFSGRRAHPLRPTDFNAVVAEAAALLAPALPAAVRVEAHRERGLWPVEADAAQWPRALMNLGLNARDAMPEGGTLTFRTANRLLAEADCAADPEARPGRFVEITVADSGCGMAPEVQARLFEPFFTTRPPGTGLGLGLAQVFGAVRAHGGWIAVASRPGAGSTFRLYLPAAEGEAPGGPRGVPGPHCAALGGPRAAPRVLVVDDEDAVRSLACAVLARGGYDVLPACDGDEALALFRARRGEIGLVLLDYAMPGLNGLQVMERLKRLDPDVPVIISSGYTMDSDAAKLMAAGACGLLPKPYLPQALLDAARDVLGQPAEAARR